ncbi:hypothetical protein CSUI_001461 [Cystoisospora suis]|uniref:Uncharacterized protein n=1 Tax=Cystoisospora suis TaxID=483139 RepID=A0A2C6KKW9_9APIC|nr:hypothetical protein CSUI_001461 [Cystoisospora suis]
MADNAESPQVRTDNAEKSSREATDRGEEDVTEKTDKAEEGARETEGIAGEDATEKPDKAEDDTIGKTDHEEEKVPGKAGGSRADETSGGPGDGIDKETNPDGTTGKEDNVGDSATGNPGNAGEGATGNADKADDVATANVDNAGEHPMDRKDNAQAGAADKQYSSAQGRAEGPGAADEDITDEMSNRDGDGTVPPNGIDVGVDHVSTTEAPLASKMTAGASAPSDNVDDKASDSAASDDGRPESERAHTATAEENADGAGAETMPTEQLEGDATPGEGNPLKEGLVRTQPGDDRAFSTPANTEAATETPLPERPQYEVAERRVTPVSEMEGTEEARGSLTGKAIPHAEGRSETEREGTPPAGKHKVQSLLKEEADKAFSSSVWAGVKPHEQPIEGTLVRPASNRERRSSAVAKSRMLEAKKRSRQVSLHFEVRLPPELLLTGAHRNGNSGTAPAERSSSTTVLVFKTEVQLHQGGQKKDYGMNLLEPNPGESLEGVVVGRGHKQFDFQDGNRKATFSAIIPELSDEAGAISSTTPAPDPTATTTTTRCTTSTATAATTRSTARIERITTTTTSTTVSKTTAVSYTGPLPSRHTAGWQSASTKAAGSTTKENEVQPTTSTSTRSFVPVGDLFSTESPIPSMPLYASLRGAARRPSG